MAQRVKGISDGGKGEGEKRWVRKGRWKKVGVIGG